MPIWFAYTLIVLLIITSILLTLLILLHRGKGGGLSSMFGGGVSSSLAGSSVAEKNLDRYTVLVGIVWFACIVGLGLWLRLADEQRVLIGRVRSYNLRAVRHRRAARSSLSAAPRRPPPTPETAVPLRRQERAAVPSGNVIRGARVGSSPDAPDRAAPNRPPAGTVTYWCRNDHRVEHPDRRRGGGAGPVGLPALRPARRPDAQNPPGRARAEPYKTPPGVREGAAHPPRQGEALLAEALAALRRAAAGPDRRTPRTPPGPGHRRRSAQAAQPGAAPRPRRPGPAARGCGDTPCTPAAGSCTGPAPASAMPTARPCRRRRRPARPPRRC